MGWKDSRGVILSSDGATPEIHSVLRWNDSGGVILSWDRTTPGESLSAWIE